MAQLQDYNLLRIAGELAVEFGLDVSDVNDLVLLNFKINAAQNWIVRRRQNWPWLLAELVIDVQPKTTGSGEFKLGTVAVSMQGAASGAVTLRHIVHEASVAGNLVQGYLVASRGGGAGSGTHILDAQFLAGTTAGSVFGFTSVLGFYELPGDFSRMYRLHTSDLPDRVLEFAPPATFERIRRTMSPLDFGFPFIYSIVPDPLKKSEKLYLTLYPYPTERQTLRGLYYRDVQNLETDRDVPIIPRKNRLVLIHVAAWMISQKLKHDPATVEQYQIQAAESLERMAQEYELSDDLDNVDDPGVLRFVDQRFDFPIEDAN